MASPERRPASKAEKMSASEKIQELLPALNFTIEQLKQAYSSTDLAKEEAAMSEINMLFGQIFGYAEQIDGPAGKKYLTRLRNFNGDVLQLIKDLRTKNTSAIKQDFTHLTKDMEALRKIA